MGTCCTLAKFGHRILRAIICRTGTPNFISMLIKLRGLFHSSKFWPRPKLACGVGAMVSIRVYRLGSRPWEVWFIWHLHKIETPPNNTQLFKTRQNTTFSPKQYDDIFANAVRTKTLSLAKYDGKNAITTLKLPPRANLFEPLLIIGTSALPKNLARPTGMRMPHIQAARASPVPAQASPGPEELIPVHALLVLGMITLAYLNSSLQSLS